MLNTNFEKAAQRALAEQAEICGPDLSQKIITTIENRRRNGKIFRVVIFSFTTLLSFIGSILLWRSEGQSIITSDVGQLLSLLFSDFGVVTSYWREYLSSLMEAIPLVSVVMVGALIWALGMSVYELVKNGITFVHHPRRAGI